MGHALWHVPVACPKFNLVGDLLPNGRKVRARLNVEEKAHTLGRHRRHRIYVLGHRGNDLLPSVANAIVGYAADRSGNAIVSDVSLPVAADGAQVVEAIVSRRERTSSMRS